jgi:hypothetical protein
MRVGQVIQDTRISINFVNEGALWLLLVKRALALDRKLEKKREHEWTAASSCRMMSQRAGGIQLSRKDLHEMEGRRGL